jgi:selenocysteine-specific elongation factor
VTVVVGTAGHIDHGKTALLRALTGIDADRLPEERRRGMTIDVGYAHLGLPDGTELDFVDVPGHDRLVGNMLVGAGEIDAALLVVAADDGPRAQTIEHLELLDALGVRHGIAVLTKLDVVGDARIDEVRGAVERLLAATALAGSPILAVSSVDGRGIEALGSALVALRDRAETDPIERIRPDRSRLAIDRVFTVKGRGLVVTGTLRGGPLARNALLHLVPGDRVVRARELQVHGRAVEFAGPGRTAINLAGIDPDDLHRGMVLTDDPEVRSTERILARLAAPLADRTAIRVHLGTGSVDGAISRAGRGALDFDDGGAGAIVRLAAPIAAVPGDRFVLRRPDGETRVVGGIVLDVAPPRGLSRRRQNRERVERLATAIRAGDWAAQAAARLDLHGALVEPGRPPLVAADVAEGVAADVERAMGSDHSTNGASTSRPIDGDGRPRLTDVRARAVRAVRRLVSLPRDDAATVAAALVDGLVREGRLLRDGDRLQLPGTPAASDTGNDPELAAAMDRLERALATTAPPSLADAARVAGCPSRGIRELERAGRIVILDGDLAYAAATYRALETQVLALASRGPVSPAALRDATGTSRKYVMAILADLDRRGIMRRTDAGHVAGPRAPLVTAVSGVPGTDAPGER